jgi:phosphoserine phosphatase
VAPERFLLTVSGRDRPGLAGELFSSLRSVAAEITDVGQITIRGHLVLCVEVEALAGVGAAELESAVAASSIDADGAISVEVGPSTERIAPEARRLAITLVAPSIDAEQLAGVFGSIARCGGDCERIVRLATYPVQSYELIVRGTDHEQLRTALGEIAVSLNLDIAVQRAGLGRRAKRLIVMDADSTLIQGEVIDRLAARLGLEEKVAAITEAAMAGALDFASALEERVALLEGLSVEEVAAVSGELKLMPGARTLVRTLQRLGFQTAVVSGGFLEVLRPLLDELGIHRAAANALEVVDGRLTGRLAGPVVDRAGKAEALRRFAEELDVPIAQTVAVGDGANDIDMLTAAGLGIAFNAHPAVREAADTALSVPYLDAVLFLLGISREEIEAADADDL